jgi:uncharacterized protein (DUF58 family)
MPAAVATGVPSSPASRDSALRRFRRRFFHIDPTDAGPVVLRHRRIYILPTRRGLVLIATILTMLVTSLNYALSLGFMVTFLLSGLVAAALLHTFRNLAGMEVRTLSGGEAFAGNPLSFALALGGNGGARTAIAVTAGGAPPSLVDVPADSTLPVTIDVPTTRRGRLSLGRVTIHTEFPLGLWHGWSYVHFPLAGVVYPAPEPDAPPLPPGARGHDASAIARGDEADLAGLRAYQPGDPLQRIAWKTVARGGDWHTKLFEGAGGGGTVDLDWNALPGGLDTETKIARLTAWVLAAERAAIPFTLRVPGAALPEGKGRDHRRSALTALALLPETPQ